jgi:hypothetical protein
MRLTAALLAGPLDASAIVAASVRGLALTTIDGASFAALTALRRLDAGGNPLGDVDGGAAVAELGTLPALAELLLARCALRVLAVGGAFRALRELDVRDNALGATALAQLAASPAATRLTRLDWSGNAALGADGGAAAAALRALAAAARSLAAAAFDGCALRSDALPALAGARALAMLSLAANAAITDIEALPPGAGFAALATLNLEGCGLRETADCRALLTHGRALRIVRLGGTPAAEGVLARARTRGTPLDRISVQAADGATALVLLLRVLPRAAVAPRPRAAVRSVTPPRRGATAAARGPPRASPRASPRVSPLRLGPLDGARGRAAALTPRSARALFGGEPVRAGAPPVAASREPPHLGRTWHAWARAGDAARARGAAAPPPPPPPPPPLLDAARFPLLASFALPGAELEAPPRGAAAGGRFAAPLVAAFASATPRAALPAPGAAPRGYVVAAAFALRRALAKQGGEGAHAARARSVRLADAARARTARAAAEAARAAAAPPPPPPPSPLLPSAQRGAAAAALGYRGPDLYRGTAAADVVTFVGGAAASARHEGGSAALSRLLAPRSGAPVAVIFDAAFAGNGGAPAPPVLHAEVRATVAALRAAAADGVGAPRGGAPAEGAAGAGGADAAPAAAPAEPRRQHRFVLASLEAGGDGAAAAAAAAAAAPAGGRRARPRSAGTASAVTRSGGLGWGGGGAGARGSASALRGAALAARADDAATAAALKALLAGVDSALSAHIASDAAARAVGAGRERRALLLGVRSVAAAAETAAWGPPAGGAAPA